MIKKITTALLFCILQVYTFAQTYNGIGGSIPDGGPQASFTINVSNLPISTIDTVYGVESVCLNISHGYVGDLAIRLLAPDGTVVDLSIANGGNGNNYTNTCFNNNTTSSIINGTPPYSGSFKPQGQLGIVNNGQVGNGAWKLLILDSSAPDAGILLNWRIVFSSNPAKAKIFTSSDLPIVVINTNGQAILDEPKITADMGIIYNGVGVRNNLSDPFNNYNNKIGIEYRGSTSQGFAQKPYGLETRDSSGAELDTSLLGLPSEHDWILYPPYNDKSFARNVLTYDLSRRMGHYAARTKFCELVVNGQYQGIYVLMEKLKRDKHRINIAELDSNDVTGDELTGGYIIKIDKFTGSGGGGWTSNYLPAAHPNGQTIFYQYEYPKDDEIEVQQESYIQSYVDSFEYALNSISFADSINGYRHFVDVNSFIDFFIINELSKNVDGYRLSTYLYKNKESKGGQLNVGPVWDFNIAYKNANYCGATSTSGWAFDFGALCGTADQQVPFWWNKFMQDASFKNDLKCRWLELRSTILNTTFLNNYIDSIALLTTEARTRHYDLYPILGVYVWPNPNPIPATYAAEITTLKNFLNSRINWLDASMPGTCSVSSAAEQSKILALSAVPNPFQTKLGISFYTSSKQNCYLELINATGDIVYRETILSTGNGIQQQQITTPDELSTGMYFLKLTTKRNSESIKVSLVK